MTASNKQGLLIILSAPSGCGKTTIVDRLIKRHPDWVRSVSMTTRLPRVGEKDGDDYYFVSPERFAALEQEGSMLESARVFEHDYGTPREFVMGRLREGKYVILAIDVQGMKRVKKALKNQVRMVTVFVLPPSLKVLRDRLEERKTDSLEEIDRRIAMAHEEIKAARFYDVTVVNQSLEQAILDVESAIERFEKQGGEKKDALHSA